MGVLPSWARERRRRTTHMRTIARGRERLVVLGLRLWLQTRWLSVHLLLIVTGLLACVGWPGGLRLGRGYVLLRAWCGKVHGRTSPHSLRPRHPDMRMTRSHL